MWTLCFMTAVVLLAGQVEANCQTVSAVLDKSTQTIVLQSGLADDAVAWGTFKNEINKTGWAFLEVNSNKSYDDVLQAYAAGAVEGFLSKDLIQNQWNNMYAHYCDDQEEYCAKVEKFLTDNLKDANKRADAYGRVNPYWHQVKLILKQLRGLSDAFEDEPVLDPTNKYLDVTRVLFFNIEGDLIDFESAFKRKSNNFDLSTIVPCSALIKVIEDGKDIYFAHDAWFLYRSMLRIQKKYSLPFTYTPYSEWVIPGHTVAMSSYPGKLVSLDDFYLLSSGLAVTETSIENNNNSLWEKLTPIGTLLTWMRGTVANRLARTGREWVTFFRKYNSGTYNNQWMVLDYKLFRPGRYIKDNTLWILEQMPTITAVKDVSYVLRRDGFWSSYNVAYFSSIFNISGQVELAERYGDYYTHDYCPRARIFRRDQSKVKDMDSMIALMRYNDYQNDPLSRCNCTPPYNPSYSISSRYDLIDVDGHYDIPGMQKRAVGGTDMKLTNYILFKKLQFVGINGPTADSQPVFKWSTSGFNDFHEGHPDEWNFGPVYHQWGEC